MEKNTNKKSASALIGAAFLMATSAIGPGFLTQTGQFTGNLKGSFGFVILVSVILAAIVQLNVWRVLCVSGMRGQDVANKVLPGLGYVIAFLVVAGGLVFNIGNVGGGALGFNSLLGIPTTYGCFLAGAIAICVFLYKNALDAMDTLTKILGGIMIVVIFVVILIVKPPVGMAVKETFVPTAPMDSIFPAILTLLGGTVGGYITFAGAHRLIDAGITKEENLKDEGALLGLKALLTYKEESRIYEFYAHVFPPKKTKEEKLENQIHSLINMADKETKEEEYLTLPQEVEGKKIHWSYPLNFRAVEILFLGFLSAALFYFSEKQKRTKEEKKRKYQMKMDYPQIINRLILYMGAGMTIRTAWFKTVEEYKKKREKTGKRAAYEEMVHTMYEIQRGKTEKECYEDFGNRCGISSYKKFSVMLSQNLQKGSKGLAELLKSEAEDAFEERKNLARKAGEETGTKLLVPMFIMLAIVMAIMVVPAFFSIQI